MIELQPMVQSFELLSKKDEEEDILDIKLHQVERSAEERCI